MINSPILTHLLKFSCSLYPAGLFFCLYKIEYMGKDKFYNQLVERYVENRATEEELEVFEYLLKSGKLDKALALSLEKQAEASNED